MILTSIAVAALSFVQPAPPSLRKTWTEVAWAELTCTVLADENERRSLNAPYIENSRDSSSFQQYFRGTLQDERQSVFRYLFVLGALGWWANRLNDQTLLIDLYSTIGVTADRYLTLHPNDVLFKQIARCARTHALSAVLEEDRLDPVDKLAAMLQRSMANGGPSLPVEDWPLLLAIREAVLEPRATNAIGRLTKTAIDLADVAMRSQQSDRAGRLLAAAAGGAEVAGDTAVAREIILKSLTFAGVPATQAVRWRSMPVLYDSQVRLTGEKDAAKLAVMLTPATPPADLMDQRTVVEAYHRLSIAAEAQERWEDAGKFKIQAMAHVLDAGGGLDDPSLLFIRHALGTLDAPDDVLAVQARRDRAWAESTLVTYLGASERLLAQPQLFIGDAREHLILNHKIDLMLAGLENLREANPRSVDRIDDVSFRLAQKRSFGRLTVAMVSGEVARAELSSTLRPDVERFLNMATENGPFIRRAFNRVRRLPGEPPPSGDVLWQVMFALDVLQSETTGKFSEYVAYLQRTVPAIAELATAHPLHVADFQRLLRPGEALVATQVTPFALYIWAITPAGVRVARQKITEAEITNTITRLRASLKPSSGSGLSTLPAFDAASAYRLFALIFAPVAHELRDTRTLIWYGQGPLGAVPPAVLVTAPPATATAASPAELGSLHFLVDRFAVAVLPDLSMFPQERAKSRGTLQAGKFLGVGAPLLSADEIDGARRSQSDELARGFTGKSLADLPKMPEAADEMKALAALFPAGQSTLLLGPAADEHEVVRDRLLSFGTIAFATHGFLADDIENIHEPSLMLALAPNAHDRFDGILTTSEIASLKLNADLVILSACNTASGDGRPHGDAFTGLTQAFFTAGARNVMVSQWPVMSGAAVQLSVGTVERALSGKETLARSLQLAMQALRKGAANALEAHPAYWGPFVIAGDGR